MGDVKRCSKCGEVKPAEAFYELKGHGDGLQAWCKVCGAAWNRAWRSDAAVKARLAAYMREYRRKKKLMGGQDAID